MHTTHSYYLIIHMYKVQGMTYIRVTCTGLTLLDYHTDFILEI